MKKSRLKKTAQHSKVVYHNVSGGKENALCQT